MKVTKYFCDVCGKEFNYSVPAPQDFNISRVKEHQSRENWVKIGYKEHVCEKCEGKIEVHLMDSFKAICNQIKGEK